MFLCYIWALYTELKMKNIFTLVIVSISIGFAMVSCQKDNLITNVPHNQPTDPNWGQGEPDSIVAPFYFVGKIDSQLYTFQDSINGYYNLAYEFADSGNVFCDSPNVIFYGQGFGMYTAGGTSSLDIKIMNCIADSADTVSTESILYIGSYPYGNSDFFSNSPGVEISWKDANGKLWKTLTGSGSSNDDTFVINSVSPALPTDSIGYLIVTGEMTVHLYNATESIVIERGEFILQYGVYE